MTASADRALPHNLEAERSILGAVITNNDVLPAMMQAIRASDFYRDAHRRIFEGMTALQRRAQAIDFVTLKDELARNGELAEVGGPAYIASLADGVPRATNVQYYARIVRENSTLRSIILTANKVVASAYEGSIAEGDVNHLSALASDAAAVGRSPIVTRLSDVQASAVDWIWEGRFARGKPTLLAGEPGLGKTMTLLEVAACVTVGGTFPDGSLAPLGNVLILTAEDDLADTIRPRIDAMGGDPSQVYAFEGICEPDGTRNAVSLVRDMQLFEDVVTRVQPVISILDPVTGYLGRTDTHRDAEVRAALGPGIDLAERCHFAFVMIGHLNKDAQRAALHRPGGSIAFVAASRIVLALVADPHDQARRLLVPLKSNICRPAPILACRVAGNRLEWEPAPVTNVDIDSLFRPTSIDEREDRTDAERVITELLSSEEWPLDAKVAIAAGKANGIAERTLRRTAKRMGIGIRRVNFGARGRWLWHAPPIAATEAAIAGSNVQDSHLAAMASMGDSEQKQGINGSNTHIEDTKTAFTRARRAHVQFGHFSGREVRVRRKRKGASSRRTPQNRRRTGSEHTGRFAPGNTAGAATRFRPGVSGNPGGRPKSLAEAIRAQVGDNGELLIKQLLAIINGPYGTWGKVDAIKEAFNRGWGKAPQTVTVERTENRSQNLLRFATDEELDLIDELNARLEARAREAASTTV